MSASDRPHFAWKNAPTKFVDVGGTKFAYRKLGPDSVKSRHRLVMVEQRVARNTPPHLLRERLRHCVRDSGCCDPRATNNS